jgi:hypothetical protein
MKERKFYAFVAVIVLVLLFSAYWLIPFSTKEFNSSSNFSLNASENNSLQYYQNMRFTNPNIAYKIENCSLRRANDMKYAFDIMSEETMLDFYAVEYGQEIIITCEDTIEIQGNLFTAGEGGPTNVSRVGDFNVIESGKILLLKDSNCANPNIAIHELLHVLGFNHSTNPQNIMYPISKCEQTIGDDMIELINNVYSISNKPDLIFENATVLMRGKYLDVTYTIRNNGLKYSSYSVLKILVDGKQVEEISIPPMDIGYGREGYVKNLLIKQIDIKNIELTIENKFEELNKTNNIISFEIKK